MKLVGSFAVVPFILALRLSFVVAQTNATDQAALLAFWNGLTVTSQGILGWNTNATNGICGQNSVDCIGENATEFYPVGFGLVGTFPTQFGLLTSLYWL